MTCLDLLASAGFDDGPPSVVAVVGGGGKTSLLFALASELRAGGRSVLVTTTTRILDPRDEGRFFDALYLDGSWTAPASSRLPAPGAPTDGAGFLGIAAAGSSGGKLMSVDPALMDAATGWDCVLVEADGARHLPVKAPGGREPVMPAAAAVVVAVIGLDCLGESLGEGIAFRPELVSRLTGLEPGGRIEPCHLAALAAHPAGSFKSSPPGAARVLVLNKTDAANPAMAEAAASAALGTGAADVVALARLGAVRAAGRIVAIHRRT